MSIEQAGKTTETPRELLGDEYAEKPLNDMVVRATAVLAGVALVAMGALATNERLANWASNLASREVTICNGDMLYSDIEPLTPRDGIAVDIAEQSCVTIQAPPLAIREQERSINGQNRLVQIVRLDRLQESGAFSEAMIQDISRFKSNTDNRRVWIVKHNDKDAK